MKKFLQYFMLITLLATQMTGLVSNITLYASEVENQSETGVEQEVETDSEIENSTESTSEVPLTTSEEVVSEASSEEATESESELSEITAKISISKNGALLKSKALTPSDYLTDSELGEDENVSDYENQLRIDANSGKSTISITPTAKSKALDEQIKNQKIYYVMDDDGNISTGSTKQPRSYEGNLLTVVNGTIVDSDNAIARTNGGYDNSFYVYSSIEDLKSNTNGVPISGGGFDATFIESVEEDGIYYDHIKISGLDGYTQAGNIQIVPAEIIKARSYYVAEDGNWTYYSAIDPVTSTEYDKIVIDEAPRTAVAGTRYYSDDDENYYTEEILTDVDPTRASVSYNSYFQNLPFRSESSYTASDYKAYLNAKGKTSSEYYNETSAFTSVQSKESVNSLMMFAMANHESAYGMSSYARACYNFFGRGAVDSDPDQACQYYSYPTATDGILAQSLFLQNGYFNVLDWRYSGIHVGNKASGMNVKYASDVDWGKKISNHAYMMDQYKGGKEENKYPILKVSGVSKVYKDSGLSINVKSSGSQNLNYYDLSQMTGTSNTVNVVATKQTSNAYQIYVPTAVKNSSSINCSYTNSKKGAYPNYGGRSNVSVNTNTANYSCDYSTFNNNKYWIKKTSTTLISNQTIPSDNIYKYEYYPSGKVKYRFTLESGTMKIVYAYKYNESGSIINKYIYQSGTVYGQSHGSKIKTVYWINNNIVEKAQTKNTQNQVIYNYEYYSGATLSNSGSKIRYRFNMDPSTGKIKDAYQYTNGKYNERIRVYQYKNNTSYGTHGNKINLRFDLKVGTSYIATAYQYRTGSSADGYSKIYTYQNNTVFGTQSSKNINNVFYIKNKKGELDYALKYQNGSIVNKYLYHPGTIYEQSHGSKIKTIYWLKNDALTKAQTRNTKNQVTYNYEYYTGATISNSGLKIKNRFNINPTTGNIKDAYQYKDGEYNKRERIFQYKSNTKYGSHGNKLKLRFDLKENTEYIEAAYQYQTGSSADGYNKIYTYKDNTIFGTQSLKTFDVVYMIKNKNNEIDYAQMYQNGEIIKNYEYYPNSIYNQPNEVKIKTVDNLNNGYVTKSTEYNTDEKVDYYYEYYSGATLNNKDTKIKYRFNINPNTGYIIDTYQYTNGKQNEKLRVYQYQTNTHYGAHGNKITLRFELNAGTDYITVAYRYKTGQSADGYSNIYTYNNNTSYGTQNINNLNYVYWIKNTDNEIDYSIEYKNGVKYAKYTYEPGIVFGTQNSSNISSTYFY